MTIRLKRTFRKRRFGFTLIEVVVALVILGISIAAIMRSFTLCLSAIRKNDVTVTAYALAESILQNLELQTPDGKKTSGDFEEEGFPYYSYELEFEEEELRYPKLKTVNKIENLRPLHKVKLTITYDNKRNKKLTPVQIEMYLQKLERFTYESKRRNELFRDEEESYRR